MGICASCLGGRRKDSQGEGEERGLLYDEANGMQYDSFGEPALNGENDSIEAQRENEALQRVVARTSNNMVDIFEIAPQAPSSQRNSTPFAYSGQGARVARYQHLVSKLNTEENGPAAGVKVDWLSEDDNGEMNQDRPASIKTLDGDDGPLVGTFADAAAAMG